jgi:exopolysaccharide production protein ExoQ
MNSLAYQPLRPETTGSTKRFPRLVFLILAVVFFFAVHDLRFSERGVDGFNPTKADLIASANDGSLARRIALVFLGVFGIASLISDHLASFQIKGIWPWIVLLYVAWAAASLTWAEDFSLTLRRLIVLAILCVAAAAITRRCTLRQIVILTFSWSLLFLLVGVSAEILLGTFQPFTSGYRFAGTQHPNSQGINCALLLLSGIAAADIEKSHRTLFRMCALLGFIFLILTASRTSFAAVIVALIAYWVTTRPRGAKTGAPFVLFSILCFVLLVPGESMVPKLRDELMLGRGDDHVESFNGRSDIWENVVRFIQQRPMLGYGYGGFWTERHITDISEEDNWDVGSAHCAYLERLLDLGAVGLVLFVLTLSGGIERSFMLHRRTQATVFAFSGAFLMFCVVDGLLESIIIDLCLPALITMVVLTRLAFTRESEAQETVAVPQRQFTGGNSTKESRTSLSPGLLDSVASRS